MADGPSWRVLEYGCRSKRDTGAGEIGLIAMPGNILAFIEVRAWHSMEIDLNAATPKQQHRIKRGAEVYIGSHPDLANHDPGFDVMIVRPWRWPDALLTPGAPRDDD
jgi:putative endonuclease